MQPAQISIHAFGAPEAVSTFTHAMRKMSQFSDLRRNCERKGIYTDDDENRFSGRILGNVEQFKVAGKTLGEWSVDGDIAFIVHSHMRYNENIRMASAPLEKLGTKGVEKLVVYDGGRIISEDVYDICIHTPFLYKNRGVAVEDFNRITGLSVDAELYKKAHTTPFIKGGLALDMWGLPVQKDRRLVT